MKETMLKTYSLDTLLQQNMKITPENFNISLFGFQIDGNTILHYFALDYDKLKFLLDHFEEHSFEYLTAILLKNNKGKSPLDIAIDNESPKMIELMLK